MKREDKALVIDELAKKFSEADNFYFTDTSGLTVEEINNLRRLCFGKEIEMKVAKNTLIKFALEKSDRTFEGSDSVLKGTTALMFSAVANTPAKIIKEFRKSSEKPYLKAAYIDTDIIIGDEQLEKLASLKSKNELIGDVIALLQSPAKNVISALQGSGGQKLSGILKTLSQKDA
ncbi:MAG: 50S ribosomal protein L10 [Chitinophagales bacterium]